MLRNIASIILVVALISCSSDEKKETAVEKNPLADMSLDLGYNLKQGSKFKFKLTTNTIQNQELKSDTLMSIKTERTENYIVDTEVIRVTPEKQNAVKVMVESIDMTGNINGKTFQYDSKNTKANSGEEEFMEYNILLNSPFRIIFGADGEISNVLDGEKIAQKTIDLGSATHQVSPEEKKYLEQQITSGLLQPICEQLYRKLPDKKVAIDSSWLVSYESGLATFKITNNAEYTLSDIKIVQGDTLLYIDADLSAVVAGENTAQDEKASYNFQDPKISGKGKIVYNFSKGVFISSDVSVTIELLIQITAKNETGEQMNLFRRDITVNNYKVQLL